MTSGSGGRFEFDGDFLGPRFALHSHAAKTVLPTALPFALTSDFKNDPQKKIQWRAFVTKARLPNAAPDLAQVNARLRAFLTPVLAALAQTNGSFGTWNHGTGWTKT